MPRHIHLELFLNFKIGIDFAAPALKSGGCRGKVPSCTMAPERNISQQNVSFELRYAAKKNKKQSNSNIRKMQGT